MKALPNLALTNPSLQKYGKQEEWKRAGQKLYKGSLHWCARKKENLRHFLPLTA